MYFDNGRHLGSFVVNASVLGLLHEGLALVGVQQCWFHDPCRIGYHLRYFYLHHASIFANVLLLFCV